MPYYPTKYVTRNRMTMISERKPDEGLALKSALAGAYRNCPLPLSDPLIQYDTVQVPVSALVRIKKK